MEVLVGSNPTASAREAREPFPLVLRTTAGRGNRFAKYLVRHFPPICNAARVVRGWFAKPKPDESPKRFDSFALRQPGKAAQENWVLQSVLNGKRRGAAAKREWLSRSDNMGHSHPAFGEDTSGDGDISSKSQRGARPRCPSSSYSPFFFLFVGGASSMSKAGRSFHI